MRRGKHLSPRSGVLPRRSRRLYERRAFSANPAPCSPWRQVLLACVDRGRIQASANRAYYSRKNESFRRCFSSCLLATLGTLRSRPHGRGGGVALSKRQLLPGLATLEGKMRESRIGSANHGAIEAEYWRTTKTIHAGRPGLNHVGSRKRSRKE